jgi:predicted Rossmann fold nucleotide-binding protein DprA/Smf involved in DNA uptake
MKIAIVGSRPTYNKDIDNHTRESVYAYIGTLPKDTVIVSGGAPGVDTWATDAAAFYGLPEPTVFKAEWDKYAPPPGSNRKNPAGMIRNQQIIDEADLVVAFWLNGSKGTKNSIDKARRAGKPVVINPDVKP